MLTCYRFVLGYQSFETTCGSIFKGPQTSVTKLPVYACNIPEEQRPELHCSGSVKSHSCFCCMCRLVLFIWSVQSVKVVFSHSISLCLLFSDWNYWTSRANNNLGVVYLRWQVWCPEIFTNDTCSVVAESFFSKGGFT
jgi:hypothetical protein